jgi:enterochelin esterase-like enzyme
MFNLCRLVQDLEPLLADPRAVGSQRATVELCGHSLGGAVALIAALKLLKKGHRVTGVRETESATTNPWYGGQVSNKTMRCPLREV